MRNCALGILLATLVLVGCGSSPTENDTPTFRNGSKAELAIQMPPLFPPEPRVARITTEAWVLRAGRLWFRNEEKDPITLSLYVSNAKTGLHQRVGHYKLDGFANFPMPLDKSYTTTEYTGFSWSLLFQQRDLIKDIIVGVAE